jgi:hypothetical protein
MVSVKCVNENCVSYDVNFNVLGNYATVECGGCSAQLIPFDLREDPEVPPMIMGDFNGS